MKIKTKLTLGVGLLFLMIILLSLVSARYISILKSDTDNILMVNYNSLQFTRNMLSALESGPEQSFQQFELNLQLQEKNITETGEKEATRQLREHFNRYKSGRSDSLVLTSVRGEIFRIMDMNMQAIQRKSELAKATADKAVIWILVSGTLCFLIAFVLLVNLPSNIADPIKELTLSIKQIAAKKYSERVHFESHSEFGELARSFNSMAERLEEYNNSSLSGLMMEKQRIETLINNMHDPVIGLDENLKVIFVNEEAVKISGLSSQQFIGSNARDLALANDLIRTLIRDLVLTKESGENDKPTIIKIFTGNKEGYFEKEILPISLIPPGEQYIRLIGHVLILRNVTEYKELDVAKTNFIATVSHEFKTPISSIKMGLQLLETEQTGLLNEEQKSLLEGIKEDANRLLAITGELLNMTQVESGRIQLSIIPSDLKEIISYSLQAARTQADQKKIGIHVHLDNDLPMVQADSEKTAWVLTNILSNAVHYSPENTPVYIHASQHEYKIRIAVKDSGPGIDPEYKARIFDRYFRVPGTKKEGTGLGLAICKEFIEAQGGEITVDSIPGEGSTFTITLNSA